MGLGRVKTPTLNLRVEIPSRFRKFENQKCLRPLLREDDRENNSAHSWLLHVFTQPGSKSADKDFAIGPIPVTDQIAGGLFASNRTTGAPLGDPASAAIEWRGAAPPGPLVGVGQPPSRRGRQTLPPTVAATHHT